MPDKALTAACLPAESATAEDLLAFAGSFDGYRAAGGFHECSAIAAKPDLNSIEELRIALFFHARAWRHSGDDFGAAEQKLFRDYVSRIRKLLSEREATAPLATNRQPTTKEVEMPSTPSTKSYSFGGCNFGKLSPKQGDLGPGTKVLNVTVTFEDALKLNLAIDECIRKLNSYKRSTTAGKRSALNIAVHLDQARITINEGKL